jgi:hypothetical protein
MSARPEQRRPPSVRLTAHPPERRGRGSVVLLQAGSCCSCCCCCCLHSVGGLVGGIIGSRKYVEPYLEPNPDLTSPFPFRRDQEQAISVLPTTGLYWALVLSLVGVCGFPGGYVCSGMWLQPDSLLIGLLFAFLVLPAVQLAASLLALFVVLFASEKRTALRRIGKITLWSFLGTMFGTIAMALGLGAGLLVGQNNPGAGLVLGIVVSIASLILFLVGAARLGPKHGNIPPHGWND